MFAGQEEMPNPGVSNKDQTACNNNATGYKVGPSYSASQAPPSSQRDLSDNAEILQLLETQFQDLDPRSLSLQISRHDKYAESQQLVSQSMDPQKSCPSSSSSFYLSSSELQFMNTNLSDDSQHAPSAIKDHPYRVLRDQLQMSGRCEEEICIEKFCQQIKTLLTDIERSKLVPNQLNSVHHNLMVCIFEHRKDCIGACCPYGWCRTHLLSNLPEPCDRQTVVREVHSAFTRSVESSMAISDRSEKEFIKFDVRIPFSTMPSEGRLWTRLCMLGPRGKAMLVEPHNDYQTELNQYWVVKKVLKPEQWLVYEKLGELTSPRCVTPLLWASQLVDKSGNKEVLVCSTLEGISLHEYVETAGPLPTDVVVRVLLELTQLLEELHALKIVYLNWSSHNVLMSENDASELNVRLTNFDWSTLGEESWRGNAEVNVPLHLQPPELLSGSDICFRSDVWGLGCLAFEMITGQPVWYCHRHLLPADLINLMRDATGLKIPECDPFVKSLLTDCWKVDPSERPLLCELKQFLNSYEQ